MSIRGGEYRAKGVDDELVGVGFRCFQDSDITAVSMPV
jgi:hypothetical protein